MGSRRAEHRFEGYWAQSQDDVGVYPWPQASALAWPGMEEFLADLQKVEHSACVDMWQAKGMSLCRICGCLNGSAEFVSVDGLWSWPDGLRHYVTEHNVQPSADFRHYIGSMAASLA